MIPEYDERTNNEQHSCLLPFILCLQLVVTSVAAASSSSTTTTSSLPDGGLKWLSHVDYNVVEAHKKLAEERHVLAVQTALEHYPTDGDFPQDLLDQNREFLKGLKFHKYRISAFGSLPDYHEELGEAPVFVTREETPLFTKEECQDVIHMAESHFEGQEWPKLPSGQYYIQGFWIKDVPSVREWFTKMCRARLFPLLEQQFPDFVDDFTDLVVDQAYLFKYIPEPGLRTEIHTDAGCLSFTFSLNKKNEYEGGGTWVDGLRSADGNHDDSNNGDVIEMNVGQCTKRVETVRQLLQSEREGLEVAIQLNPRFDGAYPNVAHHYETDGDTSKAKQVLEDCLKFANPKSSTASYYLGTIHYKEGGYDKARECMNTCLEVDPTDGDAMGTLAQIHAKLGQREKEHAMYQKIITTPGVSKRIPSNAYCNLGTIHEGNMELEMEYYKRSINYEPRNVAALQSLGSVYASQQNWEKAIPCYRQAVEVDNKEEYGDPEILTLLYRAATRQLQAEISASSGEQQQQQQSRQAMMDRLGFLMGKSNLDRLMKLPKKS